VGVVCTEYYDELDTDRDYTDDTTSTSRLTRDDVAHETWSPVETVSGVQSVRFTIPPDAPFSYRGECLSFKWELVAHGRRSRGREKRVLRSAMSPRFKLELDRERYTPGETIKGTILVREGGGSRALEAILEYKEETADYSEVAISIPSGPLHEGELTAGTSFEFELASRRMRYRATSRGTASSIGSST
jgi:hypothetical protein